MDITINTAIHVVAEIERVVEKEVYTLPPEERSMAVGIIAGTMRQVADRLGELRMVMEINGEAPPPTEEQLLQIRMIFRHAREHEEN